MRTISDISIGQFICGDQGALAQRRSNYQGNQFALATEIARKAASVPFRNRAFAYNQVANWKARYFYCSDLVNFLVLYKNY